jgi:crotonobetainyl-CoA:carnitine CoA-transferase CaiB-like acyl-CoA transferase
VAHVPLSMSVSEGGVRQRAPLLGEHTNAILAGLGYGEAEIAALRERRVV